MRLQHILIGGAVILLVGCGGPGGQGTQTAPTVQAAARTAAPTIQAAVPTVVAAAPTVAATVVAAATQVAPTVRAAAPTAVAAATHVAPTVAAVATRVAPITGTVVAASPVQIVGVKADPADPAIRVQNSSSVVVDLSGFTLRVGDASMVLPQNVVVQPGETVTLHLITGANNTRTDIYLGQAATTVLTGIRAGARVALVNNQGQAVAQFTIP